MDPVASNVDSKYSPEQEEAGFAGILLGLGLTGHLTVLTMVDICDFLTQVSSLP